MAARRIAVVCAVALLLAAPAWAAKVTLAWTGDKDATHYRIYMSTDGGQTWASVGSDILQPAPWPVDETVTTMLTDIPEDRLVLFRASVLKNDVETLLPHKGAWYDHRSSPPGITGLNLQ